MIHIFPYSKFKAVCSRLFSPELFEMFIDVGHYVRDITAYEPLQEKIALLTVRY